MNDSNSPSGEAGEASVDSLEALHAAKLRTTRLRDELAGVWHLREFRLTIEGPHSAEAPGPKVIHPFGEAATGQITYTRTGYMSALLSAEARPRWGISDFKDLPTVEDGVRAKDVERFIAYGGQYRVEDGLVHHDLLFAHVPDFVGKTLTRKAKLEHGVLTLTVPPKSQDGVTWVSELVWRRAAG